MMSVMPVKADGFKAPVKSAVHRPVLNHSTPSSLPPSRSCRASHEYFAANISTCTHCVGSRPRDGALTCPSDGKPVVGHAVAGQCPQSKFVQVNIKAKGTATKLVAEGQSANKSNNRCGACKRGK